jgi:hypothetical protein
MYVIFSNLCLKLADFFFFVFIAIEYACFSSAKYSRD